MLTFGGKLLDFAENAASHRQNRCERRESRTDALSQAGAPLSWTSERADTFFVCERVRKAAAHKRQPQRAERAMQTERAEALFLWERRQRRRIHCAMREQWERWAADELALSSDEAGALGCLLTAEPDLGDCAVVARRLWHVVLH
jgi:hypothetical protein